MGGAKWLYSNVSGRVTRQGRAAADKGERNITAGSTDTEGCQAKEPERSPHGELEKNRKKSTVKEIEHN